jgi:hypothetical protein
VTSAITYMAAGIAACLAVGFVWDHFWSFRAQATADYATERPLFDLKSALGKTYRASGVIFDYSGRVNIRFRAVITGTFTDSGGVLDENFFYDGRPEVERRQWQIQFTGPASFTATAADVIGQAKAEVAGNALRMTYRLRLPERAGGHVLDVVDWLYLMEDGSIVNRSDMRKFGLRAAELFATFQP